MESTRQAIDDCAAAFLQRRDGGSWSETDQQELTAWIAAATAHRVAFLRTEAAWEEMRRLKALGAGFPRRQVPTPEVLNSAHFFGDRETDTSSGPTSLSGDSSLLDNSSVRRSSHNSSSRTRYFLAASFLMTAVLAISVYAHWFRGDRYTTPVGRVESVPLRDGSRLTLNTSSKVRVLLSLKERHIELQQGEAFFEVAKDSTRPFIVQAGERRVIAIGTKFSVRRDGEDLRVVVTEGSVRLEANDPGSGSAEQPDAIPRTRSQHVITAAAMADPCLRGTSKPNHRDSMVKADCDEDAGRQQQGGVGAIIAPAGTVARVGESGIVLNTGRLADAEDILSWRSGYVVFHNTSLADAVAEFNRYNGRQILIQDPTVATFHLTGKFRATNSDAFMSLLEQTFRIQVKYTADQIVVTGAAPSAE